MFDSAKEKVMEVCKPRSTRQMMLAPMSAHGQKVTRNIRVTS
jgi:hypothetical protein